MRALRPATAGSNRSAMDSRPLGRSPMPVRLQAAVTTSNIQSQVAALKGEIVMLQHRFQETRLQGECHHEMETLERRLMNLTPTFPDDGSSNFDVKCTLLEIMVEQMKNISAAALERCGVGVDPAPIPSRTHTFLRLIDYMISLADRKRVWDARVSDSAAQRLESATPSEGDGPDLTARAKDLAAIDLAMNEPTAAEVRRLVAEQKQLQEQIKAMLAKSSQDPRKDLRRSGAAPVANHAAGGASATDPPSLGGSAAGAVGAVGTALPGATGSAQAATTSAAASAGYSTAAHPGDMSSYYQSSAVDPSNGFAAALQAKLDAALQENADFKKRIAQLELALQSTNYAEKVEADEIPVDVAKRIRGLAFGADYSRIVELGVPVPTKPVVTDENGEKFAVRVHTILAEFSSAYSHQLTQQASMVAGAKGAQKIAPRAGGAADAPAVPGTSLEGILWATLVQQSKILADVLDKSRSLQAEAAAQVTSRDTENGRLQRVIATLEQRIQLLKVQQTKTALASEANADVIRKELDRYKKLYEDQLTSSSSTVKRIVNAKGQIATAEERERTLKEEIANRQQSIGDLTEQLRAMKVRLEEEQSASAAVARERQSLIQARDQEAVKVSRLILEAKEREEALQNAKEALLTLKKDMRDKNVAETEMQQKTWKLEVELHIAQNVIAELRQREAQLSKIAKDADTCREELQEEVYRLRDEIADNQSNMESKLEDARQELASAKAMLKEERQKLMNQEKEVERLRIVDLKMESLEQNFTNYAASKIAQREAGEEEERMLGACLEALDKDAFIIPKEREGEAQLQLYERELRSAKEQYDTDERVRKRSKGQKPDDEASNKKKLVLMLQSRLTEIQLFACHHRLQQMSLERQTRNQHLEIKQLQASQEMLLQELSQVRLQCEALAHRNSELEIERKQFLKQRSSMEGEVKNLKANAQRLRVSHDEQEKLLVDMGTKLQSARMQADVAVRQMTPLPSTVMGVE